MTRCELFYKRAKEFLESENFEALERFCRKEAKQTLYRIKHYIDFWENYMSDVPIGTISEGALRPVIEEGDPDIAVKVVEKLKPMVTSALKKRKKRRVVTGEVVRKAIAEVKGIPYKTRVERKEERAEREIQLTAKACEEFQTLSPSERSALLADLRRIADTLGEWAARLQPNLSRRIAPLRGQVESLRRELLMFVPTEVA